MALQLQLHRGTSWIPIKRRARRALFYAFVAIALNVLWTRVAAPFLGVPASSRSPTPTSHHPATSVDFAWGSILHRFQNHPKRSPVRPPLPKRVAPGQTRVRTLIVTAELAGLHKNGGIGTAFLELAMSLGKHESIEVSILVADVEATFAPDQVAALQRKLSWLRIGLHFVEKEHRPFIPEGWTATASKRVYDFLRQRDGEFDIIHFAENSGIGYFSALARHEGLALRTSRIVVGLHGAQFEWAEMLNKRYPSDRYAAEMAVFERQTAELADAVVSPSEYMLEYVRTRGWTLPPRAIVVPNVVADRTLSKAPRTTNGPLTELVFFGRLEERKGIRLFVETLELLFVTAPPDPPTSITKITFLGKDVSDVSTLAGASSLLNQALLVIQSQSKVEFDFAFIKDADRDQALAYLEEPHRLAVMPSLGDNSPSTVLECISRSIRFIASDVGGVPELVHPDDQAEVLFKPLAKNFAAKISAVVLASSSSPLPPSIRPHPATKSAQETWFDLHHSLADIPFPPRPPDPSHPPLVSICITSYERTRLVGQLLDSIQGQTYKSIEVILVDDGSESPEATLALAAIEQKYFKRHGWTLLRIPNSYLGEARNRGAALAKGAFLFFLDDDDVIKPRAVETLVSVARETKATALSSWLDEFASDVNPLNTTVEVPHRRTYWFLGQSLAAGTLWNSFGSGNIFVERGAFEALGGFSTYREVGGEDWEFYMRLALGGYEQLVVPDELMFVRSDSARDSMKYAMDPWDAGYHALVPLLNDKRTQELGLAHAIMYARSHFSVPRTTPTFADSRGDFQASQGWNGWLYSFEPAGSPPTLEEEYLAVVSGDHWSTGKTRFGRPYINQQSQSPFVSAKGGRIAAVRSFRSPTAMDVSVHLSYQAMHKCGDGTRLSLFFRKSSGAPAVELAARMTRDVLRDDIREDVSLEEGSTLHVFSDPLKTDECDEVDVRITLTVVDLMNDAWSNLARKAHLAERARADDTASVVFADVDADTDTPEEPEAWEIVSSTPVEAPDFYHIALIFDEARFPHAAQVIRSAQEFITSRNLFFHIISPLSLHQRIYALFEQLDLPFTLYNHALCYHHARAVLPFSDPGVHISAHCKMFLSEILTMAHRVLYLDTDTTILSDISACYSEPERPKTLFSVGVDMGDGCQLAPDLCWPIGVHWRVPEGLVCGNVPELERLLVRAPPVCAAAGELETVQVNGGVILFELTRMKDWNFVEKYVQSVVYHFRTSGKVALWGEQDFINSYIRLFPRDFEFLPCGCNFQWFGSRQAVKCGEQPLYIAHHWSHGIAARSPEKPFNTLFYHFLDNSAEPLPLTPELSPSLAGSPNSSTLAVVNNANCPRQSYDCTRIYQPTPYGQKVSILSRIVSETFASDLVASIASQTYPNLEHFVSVRDVVQLPKTSVQRIELPLLVNAQSEYDDLCSVCGTLAANDKDCLVAPLDAPERKAYFDCVCETSDESSIGFFELEAMVTSPGWILYLDDDKVFASPNSLAYLMAQVDREDELIIFRSNTTRGEQQLNYQKKIVPRSQLEGLGFLFHSSNLDRTEWDGRRCGVWRTFESLSARLKMRWIKNVPTISHPLQHRLRSVPSADFGLTVVVFESQAHPAWLPLILDVLDLPEFRSLVNTTVVVSLDSEPDMFGDLAVLNPSPGSGLAEVAGTVETAGVLLLSDSIMLDKPALTALVNVWLDNPLRLVGPFSPPYLDEFALPFNTSPDDFYYGEEPDPLLSPVPFSHLLPRALLTPSAHLKTLASLVGTAKPSLNPSCHGVLLNGIAALASGKPGVRVLLPDESLVDRVHDCRARGWAAVVPGPQPGDQALSPGEEAEEVLYTDCVKAVEGLLGPKEGWAIVGGEVTVAGPQGVVVGVERGVVKAERWKRSRRMEKCWKEGV